MNVAHRLNRVAAVLALACFGCGGSQAAGGGDTGGSGGAGTGGGGVGSGAGGHAPSPSAFDACGGKIVSTSGAIDAAEYKKQANAWSLATIDCRLGPDFTALHGAGAKDTRPTAYQPPVKHGAYAHNGQGADYDLGGPAVMTSNVYGSVVNQVLYVPDSDQNPGLDRIQTYEWTNNLIAEMPEKVWWGTPDCWWPNCHSNPDPAGQLTSWSKALGHPLREPITAARTYLTWANDALVLFQGGFIGATGSQTSSDTNPFFRFPPNKVPTALATTSYNEFLLVTIWDTDKMMGQVAVIALEGTGLVFGWPYMGFPNAGSFNKFKLLGYIDLPDMATPTAIDAAGDNGSGLVPGGIVLSQHSLDTQAGRDDFAVGGADAGCIASAGYAIVASRWEGKVSFVDLQPLYAYMQSMYLTTQANFDKTKSEGPGPNQWPYTFDVVPQAMPKVVTTVSVDHPQAVLAGRHRYDTFVKAYVASLDGTVRAFDVSTLGTTADAKASDVHEIFHLKVGSNPTRMIWPRQGDPKDPAASPYDFLDSFVVVSRGDREIDWVTSDETSGKIFRRFSDTRLGDPVDIDIGERAYVMTVADFAGKAVVTYRFAPTPSDHVTPAQSFGMGKDGAADAECGEVLKIEGHPFKTSSTNVN